MHHFFRSEFFNFEFVRILSAAPFGGADIAECLVACSQIRDGDPESWHRAWYTQAEKVLQLAEEASQSGDNVSARRSYLRASNYFRASAYMFLDLNKQVPEPRVSRTAFATGAAFKNAMDLVEAAHVSTLDIPFESGATLPAYLYTPVGPQKKPSPLLVHIGGADSTKEELYYVYAATGPELGYAVLTFDGPGQGSLLRGKPGKVELHTRPDWENVISHVLDHLESLQGTRPDLSLDLSRIAVAGASMGAYYALRAAGDPRIKACIALDPFFDMYDFAVSHVGVAFGGLLRAWASGWIPTTFINGLMGLAMDLDFRTYWEVGIVQWFMGAKTPTKALLQMRRYSFRMPDGSNFLERIKCPVLISSAGQSLYLDPGTDAKLVHDGLSRLPAEQKPIWSATKPEEGGLQAKIGAINLAAQKTFEFLSLHMGARQPMTPDSSLEEYETV